MQYNCIMKSAIASVSSAGLALLAHVPCCGSTVLFAFGGMSVTAGWLHALEPYRWWLVAFSLLSLGFGFWGAYKKPYSCHDCGSCDSDVHAKRRVKIGSMWFVTCVVVGITLVGFLNTQSGHVH